jgi:hypothetical protein
MGIEQRGNGLYYYRKERRAGRVVSVYAGCGLLGTLASELDAERRAEQEYKRKQERAARGEIERQDKAVRELSQIAQTVARAVLLAEGCHTHKGQWRKCKKQIRQ